MRAVRLVPVLLLALVGESAFAATSTPASASPMGGNGYGLTFDGRLFIVRQGGSPEGWFATVIRPQRVATNGQGLPVLDQGAFAPFRHIQNPTSGENALAICQTSPQPFRCNDANQPDGNGAYVCYDVFIFDSNAEANQDSSLHRRRLLVRTDPPENPDAEVREHLWTGAREMISTRMRGIEPTMTKDGHLMLYQGHPNNNGDIDVIMYSYNVDACGLSGWSAPRPITRMYNDPTVRGRYPIAERQLRATDGALFADGALFYGAYPWVFPDGDALLFTATVMPCRVENDPPGCGPRRNALSVIGYPTHWAVAHIDGALNPDTNQTVRLFFNSPGPRSLPGLPRTQGTDVWPLFGSNTSNYAELVLDEGLDGQYGGLWHFNEAITRDGIMDTTRSPDTSGWFQTAQLSGGAYFPQVNNGVVGKAIELDGVNARVTVQSTNALNAVNALTVELHMLPRSSPDCDGSNNYRLLLQKGDQPGFGSYSLVVEDDLSIQASVNVNGERRAIRSNAALPVGEWSHIAFTYKSDNGEMKFFVNGQETASVQHGYGVLDATTGPLTIGGPPHTTSACPSGGDGAFHGAIDEVKISRVVRYGQSAPPPASSSTMAPPQSSSEEGPPPASSTSDPPPPASSSSTMQSPPSSAPPVMTSSSAQQPAGSSTMTAASSSGAGRDGGMFTTRMDGGTASSSTGGGGDEGGSNVGCASTSTGEGLPWAALGVVGIAVLRRQYRHRLKRAEGNAA